MSKKRNKNILERVKGKTLFREMPMAAQHNPDDRTVKMSFSSEEPYLREDYQGKYYEILDHSPGSVRLDRLNSIGSLLYMHDPEQLLGSVKSAAIEERRGVARVGFSSVPEADDKYQMVKETHL